jgi:nitrite reductase/ring-hydroxylating ferredoxin subunit
VAAVSEIPPGTRKIALVAGRSIGIFNVEGRFHALRNQCPHQGGPLASGTIVGVLESPAPGVYVYDPSHKFLKCPWHSWEFDMETGQSWFDPVRQRVRKYPVTVEPGQGLVTNGSKAPTGREPGPYVAETVRVEVKDDYVVVEI